MSNFIRLHENADFGDEAVPQHEALLGSFGLIPHWAKDNKIARQSYNARTETVAKKTQLSRCLEARSVLHHPGAIFL